MTTNGRAEKASKPAKGVRTAPAAQADIPDDPQELAEDIRQTRAQVGQTVEALTASWIRRRSSGRRRST